MKLYATTTSDRCGRPAKKGGDESITTQVDTASGGTYFFEANEATGVVTLSKIGKNERSISVLFSEKIKTIGWEKDFEKALREDGFAPENLTANDGSRFVGWSKSKGETKTATA